MNPKQLPDQVASLEAKRIAAALLRLDSLIVG